MKKLIYLLPLSLVFWVACNTTTPKAGNQEHQDTTQLSLEVENHDHHEEGNSAVQLDNGKKWKANPETITGINNMLTIVQDGIIGKKEASKLYAPLKLEFQTIFDKCTMEGESHNQLHNFLLPLKDKLEGFEKGNINPESLKEMQDYLQTFNTYFE
ncbi:MAG: hypothetical protein ABI378_06290 [Chitinophagaceae bacterium]